MASVAALLLAAGESTRMGRLKALLPWRGQTLLDYQLDSLLSGGVPRTVVVLGHESERLESLLRVRAGVEWVYNPQYVRGKTTSIKTGLSALRLVGENSPTSPEHDALLILNVDQPRSGTTVRRAIELHFEADMGDTPGQGHLITVPTYQGKGGHPIILSPSLEPELAEINEDTFGLKALVRRHQGETRRVEMDDPEVLMDLNTPGDYRAALETLSPE